MAKQTIPRRRGKLSKQDPPVYLNLVDSMGFHPSNVPEVTFQEWNLNEKYPPSLGELLLPPVPQEEADDPQGREDAGDTAASGGSGTVVPGGSEDGDTVGQGRAHRVTEDTEGTPPLPCGGGAQTS